MMEPEQVRRFERHMAALARAAADDPAALAQAVKIVQGFIDSLPATVEQLRVQGFSWADIGDGLGISRQVAHRKYRRRPA